MRGPRSFSDYGGERNRGTSADAAAVRATGGYGHAHLRVQGAVRTPRSACRKKTGRARGPPCAIAVTAAYFGATALEFAGISDALSAISFAAGSLPGKWLRSICLLCVP